VQVERAVSLRAVQEDRDAGDGDVRRHQCVEDDFPPGCVRQPIGEEVNETVEYRLEVDH